MSLQFSLQSSLFMYFDNLSHISQLVIPDPDWDLTVHCRIRRFHSGLREFWYWGRTNVLYTLSIIPISRDRIVLLIIPRVLLALEYATIKSSTTITLFFSDSKLEWMFVRLTCITLHLSTLNAICQMFDQFESVYRSSSLSSSLLTVLISLVSPANLDIELITPQFKSFMNIKNRTGVFAASWFFPFYGCLDNRDLSSWRESLGMLMTTDGDDQQMVTVRSFMSASAAGQPPWRGVA